MLVGGGSISPELWPNAGKAKPTTTAKSSRVEQRWILQGKWFTAASIFKKGYQVYACSGRDFDSEFNASKRLTKNRQNIHGEGLKLSFKPTEVESWKNQIQNLILRALDRVPLAKRFSVDFSTFH